MLDLHTIKRFAPASSLHSENRRRRRRVHRSILTHFAKTDFAKKGNMSISGITWSTSKVERNPVSRWFVSKKTFNLPMFPVYTTGPAYIMASAACRSILKAVPLHLFLFIEDAFYAGIVAERVKRFNKERVLFVDTRLKSKKTLFGKLSRFATFRQVSRTMVSVILIWEKPK
ncbi:hypothetical protein L596_028753 [Steinernema carpocapsae]|uniref:Hexosyltransferase n=2 Tax=Steinernema carpocapsae TaxID=34508 RepID=A0A4U5LZA8_STECR|nr:hypothetical protein L596_028753 [Steinernema carpocapsae]